MFRSRLVSSSNAQRRRPATGASIYRRTVLPGSSQAGNTNSSAALPSCPGPRLRRAGPQAGYARQETTGYSPSATLHRPGAAPVPTLACALLVRAAMAALRSPPRRGGWRPRPGELGGFPVSRFPSIPGSLRGERERDVCADAPGGRQGNLWPMLLPAGKSRPGWSICPFPLLLFLAGTCRQPSPIMRGTSSAGPDPARHPPQQPRARSLPEGMTAPEPPAPASRLCGTRPADRGPALTPRRRAASVPAVSARMRCPQTSPATTDANGAASDGSDPGVSTPPNPPSGSRPPAAPEARAPADPHTPGGPKRAPRRASSDADTPRSRNCAAKPDPVPRRQPPPEHHEACAHTSPNAACRRSGGNPRDEHAMPPARQSGTVDPTVGNPRSMRAALLHLQLSPGPSEPMPVNLRLNANARRGNRAR